MPTDRGRDLGSRASPSAHIAGIGSMATSLYGIRASRASPPHHASADPARRALYGAALAQFDELITAAHATGSASRPLPLFYALSQAGRVIAAAHLDAPWVLRGHGLSAPVLDVPLLDVAVYRRPGRDAYSSDSLSGVAAATDSSELPESATIGALWCSLPEAFELLPASHAPDAPPLRLAAEHDPEGIRLRTDPQHVYRVIVGFPGNGEQLAQQLPAYYPTAGDAELFRPQGLPSAAGHHTQYGIGYLFRWPTTALTAAGHETGLDQVAPDIDHEGCRWLRPAVAGVALSPLLTWWSLLFGLSMLARYEPATWTAALNYDTSELAAPLDELLHIALERVPELVFTALYPAV